MAHLSSSKRPAFPFLFPKAQSTVLPDPSLFLPPSLLSSPLPTSSFFQNFTLKNGDQPEYIHPYLIKSSLSSLSVSYPSLFHNSSFMYQVFVADLTISATNKTDPDQGKSHVVSSYSDLSVTLDMPSAKLRFFLVRGSPFLTCLTTSNTEISISTIHAILSFYSSNSLTKYTVKLNNNQTWLIYSSSPINMSHGLSSITSEGFSGIIRIAVLPDSDPKYEAILDRFSSCYPISGDVAFTKPFCLEYKWEKKGWGDLLMLAHPLHLKLLSSKDSEVTVLDDFKYNSVDGELVGVVGDSWVLKTDPVSVTWHSIKGIKEESYGEIVDALVKDVGGLDSSAIKTTSSYFYGKLIARAARLALIAEEVSFLDVIPTIRKFLKETIEPWLEGTFAGNGFLHDDKWGGIVTKQGLTDSGADFGFGIYNDHHYHLGYFLYGIAVLAKFDLAWGRKYRSQAYSLMADFMNLGRRSYSNYTRLRCFDLYKLHSWAGGLTEFADGRNQESTSEAVNAYYSAALMGLAYRDTHLVATGSMLAALEIHAARTWWQVKEGDKLYTEDFTRENRVVGVLWASKRDSGLWFAPPEWKECRLGIQLLPLSPISEVLFSDVGFARELVNWTLPALGREGVGEGWKGFVYALEGIYDKEIALEKIKSLNGHDDGNTLTNLLWWIHSRGDEPPPPQPPTMAHLSSSKRPAFPFLFPKAQSTVLPDPSLFLSPSLLSSPLPTSSFFQNFTLKNGDQPEYIHPYLIKSSLSSLSVSYPSLFHNSSFMYQVFVADLTISATNKTDPDQGKSHVVSSYSDLSVTLDMPSAKLRFFLVRGSPFLTCLTTSSTEISISTIHAILSFYSSNSLTKYTVKLNNNQTWLIYSSSPINMSHGLSSITSEGFSGIIRIAVLPDSDPKYEAILDRFSSCYPISGDVAFTKPFCLEYKWEKKGWGDLLMLAHPLHLKLLSSKDSEVTVLEDFKYNSVDGELVGVVGDSWVLKTDPVSVTWHSIKGIKEESYGEIVDALVKDVGGLDSSAITTTSSYFYGKLIARAARLALIAEEVSFLDVIPTIRKFLKETIEPWLEGTFAGNGFLHDDKWGGIVTKQGLTDSGAEFGFGIYNNHHYHLGYFLYGIAVLAKFDLAWGRKYRSQAYSLMADFMNLGRRSNSNYTRLRCFDLYKLHSWAGGLTEFADGRNQENTSEAVNAYYSAALMGLAYGDTHLVATGSMLAALEIHAARTWWQVKEGDKLYTEDFTRENRVVGVLWASKRDSGLWFAPPEWKECRLGIQLLPLSPISEVLFSDVGFARELVNWTLPALGREGVGEGWKGFVYALEGIYDKEIALEKIKNLNGHDDGNTLTNLLWWIHSRGDEEEAGWEGDMEGRLESTMRVSEVCPSRKSFSGEEGMPLKQDIAGEMSWDHLESTWDPHVCFCGLVSWFEQVYFSLCLLKLKSSSKNQLSLHRSKELVAPFDKRKHTGARIPPLASKHDA